MIALAALLALAFITLVVAVVLEVQQHRPSPHGVGHGLAD